MSRQQQQIVIEIAPPLPPAIVNDVRRSQWIVVSAHPYYVIRDPGQKWLLDILIASIMRSTKL